MLGLFIGGFLEIDYSVCDKVENVINAHNTRNAIPNDIYIDETTPNIDASSDEIVVINAPQHVKKSLTLFLPNMKEIK